jgi:ribosomal protein S18 acetylase RimI-like enzyme
LDIRILTARDIDSVLEITERENWGYTTRDFENALYVEPKGCFVAGTGSEIVGLTTTINYGRMGWIGNVVVRDDRRGEGIGHRLVVHAAGYLKARGVRAVMLNSYLDSVGFYSRMGFEEDDRCIVFSHQGPLDDPGQDNKKDMMSGIRNMTKDDLGNVFSLDNKVFGSDRTRLLGRIWEDNPELCHVASDLKNDFIGFTMGIGSAQIAEIGPWVCARDIQGEALDALLIATVLDSGANTVLVVVPSGNDRSTSMLDGLGFKREFEVATMRLGETVDYGQPGGICAIGSLAHG